jgi:HlyD family secretion protein
MKSKRIILIVLVAVAATAGALAYKFLRGGTKDEGSVIRLSGNIEVTDAEISFKIPGRVEKRLVSEGDVVQSGQTVAVLDSSELAEEVALRRAEVATAGAELAELEAGSRPEEIAAAEANLAMVKAEEDRLRTDRQRLKGLYDKELISAQAYDAAVTAHEVAAARVRDAQERLTLVRKGPRQERIAQARARLQRSRQALAISETRLGYVTVASPVAGVVLSENIEPGEYVSPGTPIVTVGELQKLWLRAYLDETDLGRVKLGQRACVSTDSFSAKQYEGRIGFIASQAEFTPKMVQTQKERVKLVYRIKVDIANPQMELKPGMPADAIISLAGDQPCSPSAPKS